MGYGSRKTNSNDCSDMIEGNPYGVKKGRRDEFSVLLNNEGRRCANCRRVILHKYLKYRSYKPYCPNCL